MSDTIPGNSLQIQSTLSADGALEVALVNAPVIAPGDDQVLLRVEAAPINPSDLITMFAHTEPAGAVAGGTPDNPSVVIRLSPTEAAKKAGRFGQALAVGLEGAGTVIAAGRNGRHLLGLRVATLSITRGMFAQYNTVSAAECVPLPDDVSSRDGAALFCNPLTALAIVETARLEGHAAIIHTAAASNLGQMLVKACREDGIPLINIVRREPQVHLLRSLGATHIVNSSEAPWRKQLREAIEETGATVAFDAIGGGAMVGELLQAIEDVAAGRLPEYSPYGSTQSKQVYIYGRLDRSPTVLDSGSYGMLWDVRNWYMPATMARVGPERAAALQMRVVKEIKTTFASHFAREISLRELLDPKLMQDYARKATGEKYLLNPTL